MVEEVAAIAISYDHQIGDGRIIRFHSGVAVDAPAATLNGLLDKLTAAADRQAARYEYEALQKKLLEEEKFYAMRREDLIRIDAEAQAAYEQTGRRSPWSLDKLPADKRQLRQSIETMEKRLRDDIVADRARIEALAKVVNGADVATNSH